MTPPFRHCQRVRYHETDAQLHVYNARYLEYVDVAMTEYFRALGWGYRSLIDAGCDPVLAHVTLEFHRPAGLDDDLATAVRPLRVGTSSFTLAFAIERVSDRAAVAHAEVRYVNFDTATRRSHPLPEAVRERLVRDMEATREPGSADGD